MNAFELATAARVVFGAGTAARAGHEVRNLGARRVLLVTGRRVDRVPLVVASLREAGLETVALSVAGEPTVEQAREGAAAGPTTTTSYPRSCRISCRKPERTAASGWS